MNIYVPSESSVSALNIDAPPFELLESIAISVSTCVVKLVPPSFATPPSQPHTKGFVYIEPSLFVPTALPVACFEGSIERARYIGILFLQGRASFDAAKLSSGEIM